MSASTKLGHGRYSETYLMGKYFLDQARLFAVLKYEITGFKDASKLRKSETMTVSYKIGRLGFCHTLHYGEVFFSNTGDRMGFDTRGSFKDIKKMSHSNFYSLKLKQTFTKKKYLANIYYLLTSLHHLFDSTDLEIYKCKTCLQSSAYMCTGLSLT